MTTLYDILSKGAEATELVSFFFSPQKELICCLKWSMKSMFL